MALRSNILSMKEAARILALPPDRMASLMAADALPKLRFEDGSRKLSRQQVERLSSACSSPLHQHAVQFFESEDFLCKVVADYIVEGLQVGAPVIIVARPERLRAFVARVEESGFPLDASTRDNSLVLLDAFETLDGFMVDGMPDEIAFCNRMQPLLRRLRISHPGVRPRAYGEMVDILWAEGKTKAAIRLEDCWNALAQREPFALLCSYRMDNFRNDLGGAQFKQVCNTHSDISMLEALPAATDAQSLRRELAHMQQRICALEEQLWKNHRVPTREPGDRAAPPHARQESLHAAGGVRILIQHQATTASMLDLVAIANEQPSRLCTRFADSTDQALALLDAGGIELCLCLIAEDGEDHALGLLHAVHQRGISLPIVAVTAHSLPGEVAERLMMAGFEDVVSERKLDVSEILRIVRNAQLRGRRMNRLLEIGLVDELTRVLNRRGFLERLELERQRCEQLQIPLSLLYFDLNDFKQVNDRYGHSIGDETLRVFVRVLGALLRKSDVIGRIGGDEFAVVCPGISRRASQQVVRRLHECLRLSPIKAADHRLITSVSAGISATGQAAGVTTEALVERADSAMYRDKRRQKLRKA